MNNDRDQVTLHIPALTVAKVIFVALLFVLAFILRDILLVIVAAVVIASSLEPSIKWFRARHVPRVFAVIIIFAAVIIILAGLFYLLFIPLLGETQTFLSDLPKYFGSLSLETAKSIGGLDSTGTVSNLISNIPIENIVDRANELIAKLSQSFFSTAATFLGGVLSFVLIIVLSFYLSVQQDGILNFLKTITPAKHRRYIVELWTRAETKIGLWLQGQLLLAVIVGVITYLGLSLLGVKHALLLAFVAGFFEIIPLFGPILAAIPAIVIAFIDGGFVIAIIVLALYVIIQQFESQLIYPLVVKKVVGVPPIISIVALVIGAKLAGFLGLLLSVPVAAILMEFFNDLERNRLKEERESK